MTNSCPARIGAVSACNHNLSIQVAAANLEDKVAGNKKKKMDNAMETGRGCPPPWLHRPAVKTSPVLIREGKDEDFSLGAQEKKPTLQLQQKKNHTKKGEIAWLCYNGDQCSTARSTDLDLDNTSSPILDTLIKYRME